MATGAQTPPLRLLLRGLTDARRVPCAGELFAEAPLPRDTPVSTAVEAVIDSSRYFVLRVVDAASGRHAFLGLGFRERDAASDFRLTLSDFERALARAKKAEAARSESATAGGAAEEGLQKGLGDLSLKDGQGIKISLPAGGFGSGRKAAPTATGAVPGLLPPPPMLPPRSAVSPPSTLPPPPLPPKPLPPLPPPPDTVQPAAPEGWATFASSTAEPSSQAVAPTSSEALHVWASFEAALPTTQQQQQQPAVSGGNSTNNTNDDDFGEFIAA